MSKSITQGRALMKYVEKHGVKRASRRYNVHLLLEGALGWHTGVIVLPVPAAPQTPEPAYRGRAEANPGHAPQKSQTWHGGAVEPVAPARLHPPPGKPVPGH